VADAQQPEDDEQDQRDAQQPEQDEQHRVSPLLDVMNST
jgi:hypothetical protein